MHKVSDKLGSVVKAARLEKHLTQKQLAERLSITPHYLMSIVLTPRKNDKMPTGLRVA